VNGKRGSVGLDSGAMSGNEIMKLPIERISETELQKSYPIAGVVPGWFFRVEETSNNVWLAEGSDGWGRVVSYQGTDDQEVLRECARYAEAINEQLARS
jgi:hypothetical protein